MKYCWKAELQSIHQRVLVLPQKLLTEEAIDVVSGLYGRVLGAKYDANTKVRNTTVTCKNEVGYTEATLHLRLVFDESGLG